MKEKIKYIISGLANLRRKWYTIYKNRMGKELLYMKIILKTLAAMVAVAAAALLLKLAAEVIGTCNHTYFEVEGDN